MTRANELNQKIIKSIRSDLRNAVTNNSKLTIDQACELMVSLLIQKNEPQDRSKPQAARKESPAAVKTEVIICTNCEQEMEPGAKFCVYCGTPVPLPAGLEAAVFCQHCGAKLAPGKHFCTKCGKSM